MSEFDQAQRLLGEALRARRKALGVTLEALAVTAELSKTHLSDLERGVRFPSLSALLRIARALEVSVVGLLENIPPFDSD